MLRHRFRFGVTGHSRCAKIPRTDAAACVECEDASFVVSERGGATDVATAPECHTRMVLLAESHGDALLEERHVPDERIGSVDYDVGAVRRVRST